ncbi:MAG: hypothetical protein EBE86_028335 [Hormoscilla sp. GUM202]|nr:hypothetical protein [Hormoscilla sp. GUM202]
MGRGTKPNRPDVVGAIAGWVSEDRLYRIIAALLDRSRVGQNCRDRSSTAGNRCYLGRLAVAQYFCNANNPENWQAPARRDRGAHSQRKIRA